MGFRHPEGVGAQLAEGEAAGAEEQDVVEQITGAAANRTEPGIGEFPRRKGCFGAGRLDVAFDTEYPRPVPPIVACLNAAHGTGRLGRIVCDAAPSVTQMATPRRT